MRNAVFRYLSAAVACLPLLAATSRADVLMDETDLIGLPSAAQPSEHTFLATDAQALTVTPGPCVPYGSTLTAAQPWRRSSRGSGANRDFHVRNRRSYR